MLHYATFSTVLAGRLGCTAPHSVCESACVYVHVCVRVCVCLCHSLTTNQSATSSVSVTRARFQKSLLSADLWLGWPQRVIRHICFQWTAPNHQMNRVQLDQTAFRVTGTPKGTRVRFGLIQNGRFKRALIPPGNPRSNFMGTGAGRSEGDMLDMFL